MAPRIARRGVFSQRLLAVFGLGPALGCPLLLIALLACPQAAAQMAIARPSAGNPEFEVVSIKPNRSGNQGSIMGPPRGDRFTYVNVTLQMLITVAYRVQNFQILGGPGWINSERYDVIAKFDDLASTPAQLLQMLRTMLEKRFLLTVHRENKEMPIYTLVKARADGTSGPSLRKSPDEPCTPSAPPPGVPPTGQLPRPVCGQIIFGRNQLKGEKTPLSSLAAVLTTIIGRTVVDRTGLSGRFDLGVEWTQDEFLSSGAPGAVAPQANDAGPSIFTAIKEQLGLKLDPQKGPVEVLVIDRAEKASGN